MLRGDKMYRYLKRFLDFVLSLMGILVLSPVLLLIALAIKLESDGPIIFKQKRLGYKGQVFNIYKFRSMSIGAEKEGVYELKNDPRVTKVGKFIRSTSLDELPQLWNVLKGEMSLIGPRPPLTYHPWKIEEYKKEQLRMFEVRPGITGLAQIKGRKNVEWNTRIELNVEYVERMSFFLDFKIMMLTVLKVLKREDNYNEEITLKMRDSNEL